MRDFFAIVIAVIIVVGFIISLLFGVSKFLELDQASRKADFNVYYNNQDNWHTATVQCSETVCFETLKLKNNWNFIDPETRNIIYVPNTCVVFEGE